MKLIVRPRRLEGHDLHKMIFYILCGSGILVTGFNGGNNNSATGDFSYGIEGFAFEDGVIVGPVREMLITGNFISLWNHLIAAGTDSRPCKINAIPTLAFSDVDFSA
jgi:PmbA protein